MDRLIQDVIVVVVVFRKNALRACLLTATTPSRLYCWTPSDSNLCRTVLCTVCTVRARYRYRYRYEYVGAGIKMANGRRPDIYKWILFILIHWTKRTHARSAGTRATTLTFATRE
jgi:hypothetical protein